MDDEMYKLHREWYRTRKLCAGVRLGGWLRRWGLGDGVLA